MKKRAFTMVELIFVIVILGILAAVAVPRLNASRADAKTAALKANLVTVAKDLETYYAANGEFCPADGGKFCKKEGSSYFIQLENVTSAPFDSEYMSAKMFNVNDKECVRVYAGRFGGAKNLQMWIFHVSGNADCQAELQKLQYADVQWLFTGYTDYNTPTTIKNAVKDTNGGRASHWMNDPSKSVNFE